MSTTSTPRKPRLRGEGTHTTPYGHLLVEWRAFTHSPGWYWSSPQQDPSFTTFTGPFATQENAFAAGLSHLSDDTHTEADLYV